MTPDWTAFDLWPARAVLAGGLVLLVGRLLVAACRQPARRAWVGVATVTAALVAVPASLLPGWVPVAVPAPAPAVAAEMAEPTGEDAGIEFAFVLAPFPVPEASPAEVEAAPAPAPTPELQPEPARSIDWAQIGQLALIGYGIVVTVLLGRLAVGHLVLARRWRSARPAPEWLETTFRSLAAPTAPGARLRVSAHAPGPVCFGVVRPRVLLPAALVASGDAAALRCVLAHELGHLHRRDPLAGWLLGLARGLYFVWPWVGGLRRQVRLAQEHLADADAVRVAPSAADYAELLIRMTRSRPAPLGAAGVRGSTSDLYRRVTMLLQPSRRVEPRCPRRWTVAVGGGLTALAILAAGLTVRPQTVAAQDPPPKPGPPPGAKAPAAKPPADLESTKALIEKLRRTGAGDPEIQKQIEELEKTLQKKPAPEAPAAPAFPRKPLPPIQFPGLIRPPIGNDPLDLDALEKELVQQQEMLRQMLEGLVGQINGANGQRGGLIVGGNLNINPDGRVRILKAGPTVGGGRLGAQVEKPTEALASQLDLPNGQGLVCVNVPADSTAGKAGIKPNDVLFEVNGKAVPNDVMQFIEDLKAVKEDQAVDIVIVRKGKKETIKNVKVPAAKVAADVPAFPAFPQGPFNLDAIPVPAFPAPPVRVAPPGRGAPRVVPVLPGDTPVAPVPPAPPAVGTVVGPGETLRVERVNDAFTVFYEKNGVKVTVTGSKEADGVKAEGIEVQDGSKTVKAESIDKLPKEYQDLAKKALSGVK